MPVTDTVADMLAVINTGVMAHKEAVLVKRSKLHENIVDIMKREGFIGNYKAVEDGKQGMVKVYLKYDKDKTPALTGVKKISKPGRRQYVDKKGVKSVYGGIGVAIVSTSQGVMTDREANEKNLGGEILCHIW